MAPFADSKWVKLAQNPMDTKHIFLKVSNSQRDITEFHQKQISSRGGCGITRELSRGASDKTPAQVSDPPGWLGAELLPGPFSEIRPSHTVNGRAQLRNSTLRFQAGCSHYQVGNISLHSSLGCPN